MNFQKPDFNPNLFNPTTPDFLVEKCQELGDALIQFDDKLPALIETKLPHFRTNLEKLEVSNADPKYIESYYGFSPADIGNRYKLLSQTCARVLTEHRLAIAEKQAAQIVALHV